MSTQTDHFKEWMSITSSPKVALLIDDSQGDTEVIVRMSRGFNIRWEVAYTGLHALEKMEQKKYQLIILDFQLGSEPDGVELFRRLKKSCPLCPVLVLSGHLSNDVIVQITQIGFAMFAQKPTVFDSTFFEQLFLALNIPRAEVEAYAI